MAWVNLNTIYATKSEVNSKVPNTRTINGKALSSNVTLGASDIKLSDNTTLQSAWDSISPLYKKVTYTSKTYDVPSGGALEFTTTLQTINGYSAVGVIETTTNHDWSFCLTRATINSNNTMTTTWMNLNQNTWKGAYGTVIVLYIKTL